MVPNQTEVIRLDKGSKEYKVIDVQVRTLNDVLHKLNPSSLPVGDKP